MVVVAVGVGVPVGHDAGGAEVAHAGDVFDDGAEAGRGRGDVQVGVLVEVGAQLVDVRHVRDLDGVAGGGGGGEVQIHAVACGGDAACADGDFAADGHDDVVAVHPAKRVFFALLVAPAAGRVGGGAVLVEHVPDALGCSPGAVDAGGAFEDAALGGDVQFRTVNGHLFSPL